MKMIGNIMTGIGFMGMLLGMSGLDSVVDGMYQAAGLCLSNIALMVMGVLISSIAEDMVEKERRRQCEKEAKTKMQRDNLFLHWSCDCRLRPMGDTAGNCRPYRICKRA